jgi:hypothetical protein
MDLDLVGLWKWADDVKSREEITNLVMFTAWCHGFRGSEFNGQKDSTRVVDLLLLRTCV